MTNDLSVCTIRPSVIHLEWHFSTPQGAPRRRLRPPRKSTRCKLPHIETDPANASSIRSVGRSKAGSGGGGGRGNFLPPFPPLPPRPQRATRDGIRHLREGGREGGRPTFASFLTAEQAGGERRRRRSGGGGKTEHLWWWNGWMDARNRCCFHGLETRLRGRQSGRASQIGHNYRPDENESLSEEIDACPEARNSEAGNVLTKLCCDTFETPCKCS